MADARHSGGTDDRVPDYRVTLANERTFLAWIRTSVGFLAAGVALVQLVPAFGVPGVRVVGGVVLLGLSVATALSAALRCRRIAAAIGRGEPLPPPRAVWPMAVGVALLAAVLLVIVVGTVR